MTDMGRRAGDMKKSVYDADKDGVIDEGASHPHVHVHATTTERDADDHTHYHNDDRGDARYLQLQDLLHGWCLADQYKQIVTGQWLFEQSDDYHWQTKITQYTPDLNDEIEYELFAQAGARTLELLTYMGPDGGMVLVSIDDVPVTAIDFYYWDIYQNSPQARTVNIVGTGKHSVKIKIQGKNPFSSDYYVRFAWLRIK